MTPINLNPLTSPFPLVEPNEDQHFHLFSPPSQGSSSSSSLLFPVLLDPIQDQGGSYDRELQKQHQQEANKYVLHGGSTDHLFLPTASLPTVENESSNILKFSICKQGDREDGSVRWMSSKMRLMRKMINSDRIGANKPSKTTQKFQDQPNLSLMFDTSSISNSSSNTTTIRTCSDCNTTKTPLWRSGPRGPKSLCNACGIRQRKARRAMAAAAAAASGTLLTTKTSSMRSKVQHKEKRSGNGNVQEYKKRCRLASPPISRKKICFEDFSISSSENSAFHQVFPQDEKEAAILLMALSCGLVHG